MIKGKNVKVSLILIFVLLFSLMATSLTMAADGTVNAQNYFEATGTSTNDHYKAEGVYIDNNGDVHILINELGGGEQYRFLNGSINGEPFVNSLDGNKDLNQKTNPISLGKTATIVLPSGTVTLTSNHHIWDFNIGPMIEHLKATNKLYIKNQADGYTINIESLGITLAHDITKQVKNTAKNDSFLNNTSGTIGNELIYKVVVENTGNYQLTGVNVYDDVPNGITILGVSEDETNWANPSYEDGNVLLGSNLTLAVDGSKTYYIKAKVNEEVKDGQKIINTAFNGGNVPRKEDTAQVDIEVKIKATVKKVITGNLGDLTRKFPFTVIANKGGSNEQTFNFNLSHGESHELLNLPAGTVLTLTEESGDYEVTVMVGSTEIKPNNEDEYIITLSNKDVLITVENNYDVLIDTGISLDSLPYIIILIVALGGLGITVVRRRKIRD